MLCYNIMACIHILYILCPVGDFRRIYITLFTVYYRQWFIKNDHNIFASNSAVCMLWIRVIVISFFNIIYSRPIYSYIYEYSYECFDFRLFSKLEILSGKSVVRLYTTFLQMYLDKMKELTPNTAHFYQNYR